VSARAKEAAAAQALLQFLAGPEARAVLAGKGMDAP
jgi:ABC-type molybdate transport system substrate-binding protein